MLNDKINKNLIYTGIFLIALFFISSCSIKEQPVSINPRQCMGNCYVIQNVTNEIFYGSCVGELCGCSVPAGDWSRDTIVDSCFKPLKK